MNDKNLNPLRLLVGLGIIAYFAWLFIQPNPNQQTKALATQAPPQTTTQPNPAPKAELVATCTGQIEQVGLGTNEIRLRITGAASTILVYTDQGNVTASTTEAGSGGEYYRVRTPGPATAVQLDNCTPLNLR